MGGRVWGFEGKGVVTGVWCLVSRVEGVGCRVWGVQGLGCGVGAGFVFVLCCLGGGPVLCSVVEDAISPEPCLGMHTP